MLVALKCCKRSVQRGKMGKAETRRHATGAATFWQFSDFSFDEATVLLSYRCGADRSAEQQHAAEGLKKGLL